MVQKFSPKDHHLKLDDDLRIIHGLLKNVWCDEFNKKATKLSETDQSLLNSFIKQHQSAALKAFDQWERENGGEPENGQKAEAQNEVVYQAVRKSMKPR